MSQEPKANPLWKWGAAIGGLWLAYTVGFEEGERSTEAAFAAAEYATEISSPVALPPEDETTDSAEAANMAANALEMELAEERSPRMEQGSDNLAYDQSRRDYYPPPHGYANYGSPPSEEYQHPQAYYTQPPVTAPPTAATPTSSPSNTDRMGLISSTAPTAAYDPSPIQPRNYGCAENGSCYGDISPSTGNPKTVKVQGYFRKDGTYVRGHYRSR